VQVFRSEPRHPDHRHRGHDFLTKFIIDMAILGAEGNEWQGHLVEELEQLKAAMEG
jgi:hypothetical protein